MRRLDSLLLAGVGVLAIHQIAYSANALLGIDSPVAHGHLDIAWILVSLAAIAGLGVAVTRSLRQRCDRPTSPLGMSLALASGFTVMEIAERMLDGFGATAVFGEAVFWFGLAATVPVALALLASVRTVVELIVAAIEPARRTLPRIPSALPTFGRTSTTLVPIVLRSNSISRRGPPAAR